MRKIHLTYYNLSYSVTSVTEIDPYRKRGGTERERRVPMYEIVRVIQNERLREAEQRRLALSLPRCRSWELGNYTVTVRRQSGR